MSCGENLLNEEGIVPYSIKLDKQEIILEKHTSLKQPNNKQKEQHSEATITTKGKDLIKSHMTDSDLTDFY